MNSELFLVTTGAYGAALVVWLFYPPQESTSKSKILVSLPLLAPFIGIVFYLWMRKWPSSLPWHINGYGAGLGRRYLDGSLSRTNNSESLDQYREGFLLEEELREAKRARSKARRERLEGRKKKVRNDVQP